MISSEYFTISKRNWQVWESKTFRYKLIIWFFIVAAVLASLPFFFQFIEQRAGKALTDPLLHLLNPIDVSVPIFLIIWSNAFLLLLCFIRDAKILLKFMIAYSLVTVMRMVFIYFIPLEPPAGLIPLKDPLSNTFYGTSFITKDLFFSGHTSTLFLIFMCLDSQKFRIFSIIGTCLVGFLLLLQHVHYTIDIIFAFPFAYLGYRMARRLI